VFGFILLLSVSAQQTDAFYFLVARIPAPYNPWVIQDSFVLPIPCSRPSDIQHARDLAAWDWVNHNFWVGDGPPDPWVMVKVLPGADGVNCDYLNPALGRWSWHVSEFLGFMGYSGGSAPEVSISPTGIERSIRDSPTCDPMVMCPWDLHCLVIPSMYSVLRELGPVPLYLSAVSAADGTTVYWSGLGTNYVYTLEQKSPTLTAQWTPVAGGTWPAKTNQWTFPAPLGDSLLLRVRGEWSIGP